MASRADKWIGKMTEAVQPHCDETVRCAMTAQPAGSWGAAGLAQISGLGQMIGSSQAKKRSGGMPKNVLLAVTDTKLIAFEYKPRGTKFKVKDAVAAWDRDSIQIGAEKKKITYLIVITDEDGNRSELEIGSMGSGEMVPMFFESLGLSVGD